MSSLEEFSKRVDDWLKGAEKDLDIGMEEMGQLDGYLNKEFDDLDSTADQDPEGAYGKVIRVAAVCGHAARKKSHLVGLLSKYVHRFISIMNRLQKDLGAVSFSITVSFPFDISLTLNF